VIIFIVGRMLLHSKLFPSGMVLSVLLTLFLAVSVEAQSSTMWSQTYGETVRGEAESLVETSDGGYAIAGWTTYFGAGGYDFCLIKTDAYGNLEWSHTYGGVDDDKDVSLVETKDGGFAMAGSTRSFGAGNSDFWLIKTDSHGNMEWNHTYGGEGEEFVRAMVQTSDGGYALVGYTNSFDGGFWLVKTDAYGSMEWSRLYSGGVRSLIATPDGGYALVGTIIIKPESCVDTYLPAHSRFTLARASEAWTPYDCWLLKLDAYGNVEWNQIYAGPDFDVAYSVVVTSDEGYAIAGSTDSFGAGEYDFWLVKTDSYGNVEWNQTYGGVDEDFAHCLVKVSDGGYALTGYTKSFGAGDRDFWLIKTDDYGNMEWNQTYGGADEDMANSLIATSDGGYAIAGSTYSFGIGGGNFWLLKSDEYGVIPEGNSLLLPSLLLTATLVTVIYKKKLLTASS
jgi:hypothetical protein